MHNEIQGDLSFEVIEVPSDINSFTIRILRNSVEISVIENLSTDDFILDRRIIDEFNELNLHDFKLCSNLEIQATINGFKIAKEDEETNR